MAARIRRLWILVSAAALACAAGCAHVPPGPLAGESAIRDARAKEGPRVEGAVALAPIEVAYRTTRSAADAARAPERTPISLDVRSLERRLAAALVAESPIRRIDPLEARTATGTALADDLADAHRRGDELLLGIRVKDARAAFLGRNGLYWPNLVLWYCLWVPSFFPRDEDYEVVIDAEATLYDVVAERPIASVPIVARAERSLDDFDRGWDLLGIFRVPDGLDAANWSKIQETLLPFALRDLEMQLVLRAHDALAPAAAARPASVLASVIDVGRYRKEPAVTSSPACAADGRAFAEALRMHGRVPAKNLRRLSATDAPARPAVDGPVTGAERHVIEDDLRNRVAGRARAGDTIVVYFAGAGTTGSDGRPYLLPADADPAQPLERCAISFARLGELLAPSRARNLIVVVDASFHGDRALGRTVLMGPASGEGRPAARFDDLARALPGWSVAVLLAGGEREGAGDLAGAGRGLFTLYLGRAIQAGPVSLDEIFAVTAKQVTLQAGVEGRRQSPRLQRWPEPGAPTPGPSGPPAPRPPWLPTLLGPSPLAPSAATATASPLGAPPAAKTGAADPAPIPTVGVETIEPRPPPRAPGGR